MAAHAGCQIPFVEAAEGCFGIVVVASAIVAVVVLYVAETRFRWYLRQPHVVEKRSDAGNTAWKRKTFYNYFTGKSDYRSDLNLNIAFAHASCKPLFVGHVFYCKNIC